MGKEKLTVETLFEHSKIKRAIALSKMKKKLSLDYGF